MPNIFKIETMGLSRLSEIDIGDWRDLQNNGPELMSPFYSPDFAFAINAIGKPVSIATIRDNNDRLLGILPFHKRTMGVASPVGGPICDFQGIIGPAKDQIDPNAFLDDCGLKAYDFNHLPLSQTQLARGLFSKSASPFINLANGFEAYVQERNASGINQIKNIHRKFRKMEREIGPINFTLSDAGNNEAWEKLFKWKKLSYKAMGVKSILDVSWVIDALNHIRTINGPHFSSLLSTAYVRDELIAVSFGIRYRNVFHGWFSSYSQGFRQYSPGLILLLKTAELSSKEGVTRFDFGRGREQYKLSLSNDLTPLCEGSIELPLAIPGVVRKTRKLTHSILSRHESLEKITEFQRRAFNRVLKSGDMPH